MKKTMNSIGWKYGLMGVVYIAVQLGLEFLISQLLPEFYEKNAVYVALAMVVVAVDLIGFPLVFLLTKNMPKAEMENEKMTFGKFLLCILMMYGLTLIGIIVGQCLHLPLTLPFEDIESANKLLELMLGSNFFVRVLIVGILAPIFEELIFRKVLIDHVSVNGYLPAILVSGIMFGLFHGNFSQAGFATLIGCLFAFIYVKTGKVIYTIILHMIMNCGTSIVTLGLYEWMLDSAAKFSLDANNPDADVLMNAVMDYDPNALSFMAATSLVLLWMGFLFTMAIAGLIVLIVLAVKKKLQITRKEGEESVKNQIASLFAPAMWFFYVICVVLFLFNYLPPIVKFIITMVKNN